jgi:hypothetical protein
VIFEMNRESSWLLQKELLTLSSSTNSGDFGEYVTNSTSSRRRDGHEHVDKTKNVTASFGGGGLMPPRSSESFRFMTYDL